MRDRNKTPFGMWRAELVAHYKEKGPFQSAKDVTSTVTSRAYNIVKVAGGSVGQHIKPTAIGEFTGSTYERCRDITKRIRKICSRCRTYIDSPEDPKPGEGT